MDESNQLFVHGRNICEAFIENGRVIRRRFPLTGCSSEPLFSTLSSSHDGCDSLTPGKSDDVARSVTLCVLASDNSACS